MDEEPNPYDAPDSSGDERKSIGMRIWTVFSWLFVAVIWAPVWGAAIVLVLVLIVLLLDRIGLMPGR